MDGQSENVIERLNRLERANRLMKALGLAIFAAVATVGATKSTGQFSTVLRTQRLQIVDDKGNVRADLGLFGAVNPNPALLLYDQNGVLRTFDGIEHDFQPFTGLVTWYQDGEVATATGDDVTEISGESLIFGRSSFTTNNISTIGFNIDYGNGFAGFFTNDANNNNRIFLGAPSKNGDKWVTLNLNDASQQTRAQVVTYDNGTGSWGEAMSLQDQSGVFRSGSTIDDPCCGPGSDVLFFKNPGSSLTGYFFSGPTGGGTFVTEDGAGSVTGQLPQ